MKQFNPYKKLTMNMLLMSLGTIGSKVISILMLRFYTDILNESQYGLLDLLTQTANLIMPIAMIGITASIVRFGLDQRYSKHEVFTTSLLCLNMGFVFCLLFSPFLLLLNGIGEYVFFIYLYVLTSSIHGICATFIRSNEKVRLYALNGILNTICNVGLMFLFLRGFNLGIIGYLLAVICADLICGIFLIVRCRLWEYIRLEHLPNIALPMILYAIPIIPTTINWYIMNTSDRFMIRYFHGDAANGLFAVAAKIPLIITIMASVFIDAWHISIIGTQTKHQQEIFFSKIIRIYESVLFVMASCVILSSKFIMAFMTSRPEFYEAWRYIPFLVCGTIFSCLATFIGSIYTVKKKSVALMNTTLLGGGINLLLNFLLIPTFGSNGAAFATFLSFILIFLIRIVHTRSLMYIRWKLTRFMINLILLVTQSFIMIFEVSPTYVFQVVLLFLMIMINLKTLILAIHKMIYRKKNQPI